MTTITEAQQKLGERLVIQSRIKEKFNHIRRLSIQIDQIIAERKLVSQEINDLYEESEKIADWLLEQEYKMITENNL